MPDQTDPTPAETEPASERDSQGVESADFAATVRTLVAAVNAGSAETSEKLHAILRGVGLVGPEPEPASERPNHPGGTRLCNAQHPDQDHVRCTKEAEHLETHRAFAEPNCTCYTWNVAGERPNAGRETNWAAQSEHNRILAHEIGEIAREAAKQMRRYLNRAHQQLDRDTVTIAEHMARTGHERARADAAEAKLRVADEHHRMELGYAGELLKVAKRNHDADRALLDEIREAIEAADFDLHTHYAELEPDGEPGDCLEACPGCALDYIRKLVVERTTTEPTEPPGFAASLVRSGTPYPDEPTETITPGWWVTNDAEDCSWHAEIFIDQASDEDGNDDRERVARRIAAALNTDPVLARRVILDRPAAAPAESSSPKEVELCQEHDGEWATTCRDCAAAPAEPRMSHNHVPCGRDDEDCSLRGGTAHCGGCRE